MPTLEKVHLAGDPGRLRKRCRYILADKGYDSDELRSYCDRVRIKPVIAQKKMKRNFGQVSHVVSINPCTVSEISWSALSVG